MPNRVLVVEDDPDNRRIFTTVLERAGYAVKGVADGLAALEECARERPDLVVIDLVLPRLDGLETLRRLRARPGFENVPFIAVTALALRGDEERARAAGCDDYLTKPCRAADLREKVKRWMPQSRNGV